MSIVNWRFTLRQQATWDGSGTTHSSYLPWNGWEFEFVSCVSVCCSSTASWRWGTWLPAERDVSSTGTWSWLCLRPSQPRSIGRGDQEPLCLAKGLHMWGTEWDVSQISRHLGKGTVCQELHAERRGERVKHNTEIDGSKNWQSEGLRARQELEFMGGKMDW